MLLFSLSLTALLLLLTLVVITLMPPAIILIIVAVVILIVPVDSLIYEHTAMAKANTISMRADSNGQSSRRYQYERRQQMKYRNFG